MEEALTILVRYRPDYVLVTVAGDVDLLTAPRLRVRLSELAATGGPVVVDLSRVRFIDAAGLGLLAHAASLATVYGGSLHVVTAQPRVRLLLSISGLEQHVGLAWTVGEAASALGGKPRKRRADLPRQ